MHSLCFSIEQIYVDLMWNTAGSCSRIWYFSVIPPHQKIRKTVEIVPEKMKKSSIEILQIRVLSKYN